MNKTTINIMVGVYGNCDYCKKDKDFLLPFGKNDALICKDCGTKPENIKLTQINIAKFANKNKEPKNLENLEQITTSEQVRIF